MDGGRGVYARGEQGPERAGPNDERALLLPGRLFLLLIDRLIRDDFCATAAVSLMDGEGAGQANSSEEPGRCRFDLLVRVLEMGIE